jgi:hypothetical protein
MNRLILNARSVCGSAGEVFPAIRSLEAQCEKNMLLSPLLPITCRNTRGEEADKVIDKLAETAEAVLP